MLDWLRLVAKFTVQRGEQKRSEITYVEGAAAAAAAAAQVAAAAVVAGKT